MYSMNVLNRRMIAAISIGIIALCAWTSLPQASAHSANVTQERGSFLIRAIRLPNKEIFGVLRINTKTGETWFIGDGEKWEKHLDKNPISEGDYDVLILAADSDVLTVRIDRAKGTTWLLRSKAWVKVEEP